MSRTLLLVVLALAACSGPTEPDCPMEGRVLHYRVGMALLSAQEYECAPSGGLLN